MMRSQVRVEPPQQCRKTTAGMPWPWSVTLRETPLDGMFINTILESLLISIEPMWR
jgi:hypothetical protein